MDKLEPIIRHRFWILVGLVAPLAIYGYYDANSGLKAATDQREGELDGLRAPSGNEANPRWSEGLKKINESYAAEVNREIVRLHEKQFDRMTWPDSIKPYLPLDDEGNQLYRGEFPDEAGFIYRDEYIDVLRDLYASVQPVIRDQRGRIAPGGKVVVDETIIPRHEFGSLTISSDEMWDAQEDVWLLQILFDAVTEVNRDAENAAKSAVRQILKVELRGGNGQGLASATTTTGSGGLALSYEEMGDAMLGDPYADTGDGMGYSGDGGGRANAKIAFDPAEEFGSDADTTAVATTSTADIADGGLDMPSYYGGAAGGPKLRYIGFDENAPGPFRERGFYLSVLVKQQKFPDFLVALSNSDWPIRIVRFHVGANPNSARGTHTGGSGYPLAGGGPEDDYYNAGGPSYEEAGQSVDEFAYGGYDGGMGYGGMTNDEQRTLLTQSDLVQLDVCGVITFYNRPADEVLAAVVSEAVDAVNAGDSSSAESEPESPVSDGSDGSDDAGAAPGDTAPASEPAEPAANAESNDDAGVDATSTEPDAATSDN